MWLDLSGDSAHCVSHAAAESGHVGLPIVATLALAIGAATIGFAFADLALFRGLPVDDNAKVVIDLRVGHAAARRFRGPRLGSGSPRLSRARATTLETAVGDARRPRAADPEWPVADADGHLRHRQPVCRHGPDSARRPRVSLRVTMSPGAAPVAVLSHHYWRDEMNGRADAIGRPCRSAGRSSLSSACLSRTWSLATSPRSISGCHSR